MPSPFPGMDPYLEGPFWSVVHANLTEEIARQLVPLLRPRYMALVQERFVVTIPEKDTTENIYPDAGIHEKGGRTGSAGTAVADAPLCLDTVMPVRLPHRTLEIRDVAKRRLVTAIEVFSPTNKRGRGRREYLEQETAHPDEFGSFDGNRLPPRGPPGADATTVATVSLLRLPEPG